MHKGRKEGHEVSINEENKKNNDLYFGLSATRVNTTKANNNEDSRIREDLNLNK